METGDSSGTFEAHLQHPTNFSSTQISRFNNVRDSSKNHLWKMKDVFHSHPQPEKAALKPVESPDSSLRFLQILQLRLDLAIVWSGSLGIGDIGHWGLVKKILQTKKNIGCTHPMIQDKLVCCKNQLLRNKDSSHHHPASLNITQALVDVCITPFEAIDCQHCCHGLKDWVEMSFHQTGLLSRDSSKKKLLNQLGLTKSQPSEFRHHGDHHLEKLFRNLT